MWKRLLRDSCECQAAWHGFEVCFMSALKFVGYDWAIMGVCVNVKFFLQRSVR